MQLIIHNKKKLKNLYNLMSEMSISLGQEEKYFLSINIQIVKKFLAIKTLIF